MEYGGINYENYGLFCRKQAKSLVEKRHLMQVVYNDFFKHGKLMFFKKINMDFFIKNILGDL